MIVSRLAPFGAVLAAIVMIANPTPAVVAAATTRDSPPNFLRGHAEGGHRDLTGCDGSFEVSDSDVSGVAIDGVGGDWDLDKPFVYMLNAGETDPTKSNYRVWGKLWLKWHCPTKTLYLFSQTEPGVTTDNDEWLKIYAFGNSNLQVSESVLTDNTWEAKYVLSAFNTMSDVCTGILQFHYNVKFEGEGGRTASTGRGTNDEFLQLLLPCDDVTDPVNVCEPTECAGQTPSDQCKTYTCVDNSDGSSSCQEVDDADEATCDSGETGLCVTGGKCVSGMCETTYKREESCDFDFDTPVDFMNPTECYNGGTCTGGDATDDTAPTTCKPVEDEDAVCEGDDFDTSPECVKEYTCQRDNGPGSELVCTVVFEDDGTGCDSGETGLCVTGGKCVSGMCETTYQSGGSCDFDFSSYLNPTECYNGGTCTGGDAADNTSPTTCEPIEDNTNCRAKDTSAPCLKSYECQDNAADQLVCNPIPEPVGTTCGSDPTGCCDKQDVCTGSMTDFSCPDAGFFGSDTVCRPKCDGCTGDVAEVCSGNSPFCPDNVIVDQNLCINVANGADNGGTVDVTIKETSAGTYKLCFAVPELDGWQLVGTDAIKYYVGGAQPDSNPGSYPYKISALHANLPSTLCHDVSHLFPASGSCSGGGTVYFAIHFDVSGYSGGETAWVSNNCSEGVSGGGFVGDRFRKVKKNGEIGFQGWGKYFEYTPCCADACDETCPNFSPI